MEKTKSKDTRQPGSNMEEKILAAAEKLFLQNGYPLTSTTQIAKEAGCNQALVHYYFRTKEKLFHAVLGGKIKKVFQKFISLEAGEGSFEKKLSQLIRVHYDTVRENSHMVPFLINGFRRDPKMFEHLIFEIGEIPRQTLDMFRNELEAEIEAGRIRPVSIHELVLNVISMNAFVFAIKPVYAKVWGLDDAEMETLLDGHREEVVKIILSSLRP